MSMESLRILFITDRFPPAIGGVAVSAQRLATGLAARGHVVHVLHLGAEVEAASVQSGAEDSLVVHRLGALPEQELTLQFAESVISHLAEHVRFDLYHGHGCTPSGYLATVCARRVGASAYVSARGNDVERGMFSAAQLPFLLWTLGHADVVGCVSRTLAEKCAALCDSADIRFTPNAVDTGLFCPVAADAALLASIGHAGEPVLGFVGELRMKKGTAFLLDAFRDVRARRPAKLLLVGGMRGEDRTFLRHYLRAHPALRDDIHVIPYTQEREALVQAYCAMDLVLCPSLWDGMPNSVLEAMACGRVVIASDVGGIRDAMRHGETGFLIGMHELHRLGEGCLEVLAAPAATRAEIGARARQAVARDFTPEGELDRLEAAYQTCLARHTAPATSPAPRPR